MINNFANNEDKAGVSPVIGVILMIAITVILGAVIGFYAVELGGSTSSNVNAGIQTEETSDGVEVRWTSSGNAERVYVLVNGSEIDGAELSSVGGSMTVSAGENDTVSVVGVDADGNETELQSVTAESDTTGGSGEPQLVSGGSESSEPGEPNSESGSVTVSNLEGDGSSSNPYVITNDQELQAMNQDLDANYVLGNDINASLTNEWNSGKGFKPVGEFGSPFTGNFEGNGYSISGLYIDRSFGETGLFGTVENGSTIQNVSLESVDIEGNDDNIGGLVGAGTNVTISNVSVSGRATRRGGTDTVFRMGLLAGRLDDSTVENSSSSGTVDGPNVDDIGGLVGFSNNTGISNSFSSANVTNGIDDIGGLVGNTSSGTTTESYATGDVSGGNKVGGLIGSTSTGAITSNSYATGDVSGGNKVGGFVGSVSSGDSPTVEKSYSTGNVSGSGTDVGGFAGFKNYDPTITDSYWDTEASGQSSSVGGTGLTTSEMQGSNAESNMSGLDFTNTWTTVDGDYPEISGE